MGISIENPYSNNPLPWHKGNLHTHTTNSDGTRDPQAIVDSYAERGYGFLMLSDHNLFTDPTSLESRGMALIPGSEISCENPHMLHVDARSYIPPDEDHQKAIDAINAEGACVVISHPNWQQTFAHCPQDLLETWKEYLGIEIYNGVIRRLDGSPLATDRWDRLLGLGRRIWGFANDDSHRAEDDGVAWNVVQCADLTRASVVEALRGGRFYASTGVTIDSVRVEDKTITVSTADAECIVVHSDFGHRETAVDAREISFTVPVDREVKYVRFECWGRGDRMAWTQPFYITQVGG